MTHITHARACAIKYSFHMLIITLLAFCSIFPAACSRKGSLHIEAQIVYSMGGPQPVARQTFYLLNTDPATVQQRQSPNNSSPTNSNAVSDQEAMLYALSFMNFRSFMQQIEEANRTGIKLDKFMIPMVANSREFLAPHIVQTVQTDFQGRATFENISTGEYWVMGITETRASFAFWK